MKTTRIMSVAVLIVGIGLALHVARAQKPGIKRTEIRSEFAPQPGDIVALEHWCSSGFANTDLGLQLKKHGIHQLIVIGLITSTWVESTVRFGAELGYEVTTV